MSDEDVVLLRTGQVELRIDGIQLRLEPEHAMDIFMTGLERLGWRMDVELGLQVSEREPVAMDEVKLRDAMERLRASGTTRDQLTRKARRRMIAPWGDLTEAATAPPARRERRFTKEAATGPVPAGTGNKKAARKNAVAARAEAKAAASVGASGAYIEAQLFTDPREQLHYEVRHAWLMTVPPSHREEWPLARSYEFTDTFMDDVRTQSAYVSRQQIVSAVLDVVCGRANTMASRQVHLLKYGRGKLAHENDPVVMRSDGAMAWRAAVSTGTPAARRIMWWLTPAGTIELNRLAPHDDFDMPE
jgi:hypothetical protein